MNNLSAGDLAEEEMNLEGTSAVEDLKVREEQPKDQTFGTSLIVSGKDVSPAQESLNQTV